jgi:hypothetical protein
MALQFQDYYALTNDISDSKKCFKILVGKLFNIAGDIYLGCQDENHISDGLWVMGELYKTCSNNYPEYEYSLSKYSNSCLMFTPNPCSNGKFGGKEIVDCAQAMEPLSFEPIARLNEVILVASQEESNVQPNTLVGTILA